MPLLLNCCCSEGWWVCVWCHSVQLLMKSCLRTTLKNTSVVTLKDQVGLVSHSGLVSFTACSVVIFDCKHHSLHIHSFLLPYIIIEVISVLQFCFIFRFMHLKQLLVDLTLFPGSGLGVPLVEFMYLVFTCMTGESYRRWLRSLLLCLCGDFRMLIDYLQKSRGLHLVSAYRHGLYIQVQACGCSAE